MSKRHFARLHRILGTLETYQHSREGRIANQDGDLEYAKDRLLRALRLLEGLAENV